MSDIVIPVMENNPLSGLSYMAVGKGKKFHLSLRNDDTLCPASRRSTAVRYVSVDEGASGELCTSCYRTAEKRYEDNRRTAYAAARDFELDALSHGVDAGFITATVTDPINNRVIISNGQFPADWDDAMVKMAVAIDHTGNGKNGFAYVVTRKTDAENGAQSVDGGTVVIQGPEGFDMTPDMSELVGDCYFGCGRPVTGMWCDYVGRTEGVCDLDRDKLGDHITVTPVDPAIWGGASETGTAVVGIVQNTPGMNGATHYHAPGCRDITREMRRYGQSQSDALEFTFSSVAEILTFEYGDIASDNAEENTPEWWANILENAQYDRSTEYGGMGVKIMPCLSIPMGTDNDGNPLQDKGSFYCFGFRQPSAEKVAEIQAEIAAHNFNTCDEKECVTCIVRDMNREQIPSVEEFPNERAYKSGTENANDYVRDAGLTQYGEEWQNTFRSSYALSMEIQATENDDTDAGFSEVMVTLDYLLAVVVDENTGATVELGWVMLDMNAAQQDDHAAIAREYGRLHGQGTPRNGWESLIIVRDIATV